MTVLRHQLRQIVLARSHYSYNPQLLLDKENRHESKESLFEVC